MITLRRLNDDFLEKGGLKEVRVDYRADDLREAVKKVDGIIGWLTLFGYSYAKGAAG